MSNENEITIEELAEMENISLGYDYKTTIAGEAKDYYLINVLTDTSQGESELKKKNELKHIERGLFELRLPKDDRLLIKHNPKLRQLVRYKDSLIRFTKQTESHYLLVIDNTVLGKELGLKRFSDESFFCIGWVPKYEVEEINLPK